VLAVVFGRTQWEERGMLFLESPICYIIVLASCYNVFLFLLNDIVQNSLEFLACLRNVSQK
jgi:hypothetical protein